MLFQTPTQYLVLVLCLLAGWLFGLASSSGGKKWRDRHRVAEVEHKRYRDETVTELKTRETRIRELEAERDRLSRHSGTGVGAPLAAGAVGTAAVAATHGHDHDRHQGSGVGGWFGWNRDNLSRIRGIDELRERQLNERGVKTFRALESLSAGEERDLEAQLGLASGTIERENWREQAAMIREGRDDEHVRRWG